MFQLLTGRAHVRHKPHSVPRSAAPAQRQPPLLRRDFADLIASLSTDAQNMLRAMLQEAPQARPTPATLLSFAFLQPLGSGGQGTIRDAVHGGGGVVSGHALDDVYDGSVRTRFPERRSSLSSTASYSHLSVSSRRSSHRRRDTGSFSAVSTPNPSVRSRYSTSSSRGQPMHVSAPAVAAAYRPAESVNGRSIVAHGSAAHVVGRGPPHDGGSLSAHSDWVFPSSLSLHSSAHWDGDDHDVFVGERTHLGDDAPLGRRHVVSSVGASSPTAAADEDQWDRIQAWHGRAGVMGGRFSDGPGPGRPVGSLSDVSSIHGGDVSCRSVVDAWPTLSVSGLSLVSPSPRGSSPAQSQSESQSQSASHSRSFSRSQSSSVTATELLGTALTTEARDSAAQRRSLSVSKRAAKASYLIGTGATGDVGALLVLNSYDICALSPRPASSVLSRGVDASKHAVPASPRASSCDHRRCLHRDRGQGVAHAPLPQLTWQGVKPLWHVSAKAVVCLLDDLTAVAVCGEGMLCLQLQEGCHTFCRVGRGTVSAFEALCRVLPPTPSHTGSDGSAVDGNVAASVTQVLAQWAHSHVLWESSSCAVDRLRGAQRQLYRYAAFVVQTAQATTPAVRGLSLFVTVHPP